jgi:hypothetical protein
MIDVKKAVQIACDYIQELYEPDQLPGLLLEEVQISEESGRWLVTLGFSDPTPMSPIAKLAAVRDPRKYKIFEIDADTGEVKSMRIRQLTAA